MMHFIIGPIDIRPAAQSQTRPQLGVNLSALEVTRPLKRLTLTRI